MDIETLCFVCILMVRAHASIEAKQAIQEETTCVSKLDALTNDMATLARNMKNIMKDMNTLKTKLGTRLSPTIAFAAKLTTDFSGHGGERIHFNDVVLNMGDAYHSDLGTFIAPVNGTYEFSLKACSERDHYIALDILAKTVVRERLLAGDTDFDACSSTTLPIHLKAGDTVFVQISPQGGLLHSTEVDGEPHFNGVLIQAD